MKPTREQFEEWRASPVTEWLLDTFLKGEMQRTQENFQHMAWAGLAGEKELAAHRERYETLEWMRGLDMETIEATLEKQE